MQSTDVTSVTRKWQIATEMEPSGEVVSSRPQTSNVRWGEEVVLAEGTGLGSSDYFPSTREKGCKHMGFLFFQTNVLNMGLMS